MPKPSPYIRVVPPRAQRVTLRVLWAFAALAMGGIVYLMYEEEPESAGWFAVAVAAFVLPFGLWVGQYSSRVAEVVAGEVRMRSWLRNWRVAQRDIVGYREEVCAVTLEFEVGGRRRRRKMPANVVLLGYLAERFPDLDAADVAEQTETLLADERFGVTTGERAAYLEEARRIALSAVVPAVVALGLYIFVYVRGWVLLLGGGASLALVLYAVVCYRGAVGFEWHSVRGGLLLPTAAAAFAVFFGTLDYGQEAFFPFWRAGLAVAAVGTGLYWRFRTSPSGIPVLEWAVAPLCFFLVVNSGGQAIDGLWPAGDPEALTVPIDWLEVSESSRYGDTYSLHVDMARARPKREVGAVDAGDRLAGAADPILSVDERVQLPKSDVEIPLDYRTYARLSEGERVEVHRYTGRFGLRWHVVYDGDSTRLNGYSTLWRKVGSWF